MSSKTETPAEIAVWLKRELANIEDELGLPAGFLKGLAHREDDWSFVVKTHALLEAAVSHQLTAAVDDRLQPVFRELELSHKTRGKIAFCGALALLTKPQRRFVRGLSELRNELVHDVTNVSFTFSEHVERLDSNKKKAFKNTFAWFAANHPPARRDAWFRMALDNPKHVIWLAALLIVSEACEYSKRVELERRTAVLEETRPGWFEELVALFGSGTVH